MVDWEKLTQVVPEKKPLWDTKDKLYHNRDFAKKLWNEIATDMSCENK
jgi:hypothetical protein